jgi:uncharacterized protein
VERLSFRNLKRYKREIIGFAGVAFTAVTITAIIAIYRDQISLLFRSEYQRQQAYAAASATFGDFFTLVLGILVEALPFVVLGVLISVAIQTYIPTQALVKRLPKNKIVRRLMVSLLGVAMPVCECGNVPVARSLMAKGFSIQESIVFLLAAPSVNIITFIVTWEAFSMNHGVAVTRVLATLVIANVTAIVVARFMTKKAILTPEFAATCELNAHAPRTWAHATELFRSEMWLITRMLIIGAIIAAASQTFIPREVITAIGSDPLLAVLAMIALAFIVSICSSVDAFFALAYTSTFSLGSLLAFLVAGPMVDIKMLALMKTTFTYRALAIITSCVIVLTFIIGMIFTYVW